MLRRNLPLAVPLLFSQQGAIRLWLDQLTTSLTAGNVDGTASEPEGATREVVSDVGSNIAISGGKLQIAGNGSVNQTRMRWSSDGAGAEYPLLGGDALGFYIKLTNSTGFIYFGMRDVDSADVTAGFYGPGLISAGAMISYYDGATERSQTLLTTREYGIWFIADVDTGTRYFLDNEFSLVLFDINDADAPGTFVPEFRNASATLTMDDVQIWHRAKSLANYRALLQASPALNTLINWSSNHDKSSGSAIITFDVAAPNPLSGSVSVEFCYDDADNHWLMDITAAGAVDLNAYLNSTEYSEGWWPVASVVGAGETYNFKIIIDNGFVQLYNRNTASGTWNLIQSQTSYISANIGYPYIRINATDYTVSNLEIYPLRSTHNDFMERDIQGLAFVMVGDSKTHGAEIQDFIVADVLSNYSVNAASFPYQMAEPGLGSSELAATISAWMASRRHYEPKAVLYNMAANDLTSTPTESVWKADLSTNVDAIHARWSNAKIYLMRVWRGDTAQRETDSDLIDSWMPDVIADGRSSWLRLGPDERQILEYADSGATHTSDQIHPDASGQQITADYWRAILSYRYMIDDIIGASYVLGHWPAWEVQGSVIEDISLNAANGSIAGSPTYKVSGHDDGALGIQLGTEGLSVFSSALAAAFDPDEFTIIVDISYASWATATGKWLARLEVDTNNFIDLYKSGAGEITARWKAGGTQKLMQNLSFAPGSGIVRYILTGSKTEDRFELYADGTSQVSNTATTGTWSGSITIARFGSYAATSFVLTGEFVGRIMILNRAVSDAEAASLSTVTVL